MSPVSVNRGSGPLVLACPHAGTFVPPSVYDSLNAHGRLLADTDWHVDRLYEELVPDATHVRANFHRYVIDANRDPSGKSLYPGQNTTGLVPLVTFENKGIWHQPPSPKEIAERLHDWHAPYHAALTAELYRVREKHGVAILFDCHSIRSQVPFLFEGRLPDFNIGTNSDRSCAATLQQVAESVCANAPGYSHVVNSRFKGGWTTRHYGKPEQDIHAIQLELVQATYLSSETTPFAYDEAKARDVRLVIGQLLGALVQAAPALASIKGSDE